MVQFFGFSKSYCINWSIFCTNFCQFSTIFIRIFASFRRPIFEHLLRTPLSLIHLLEFLAHFFEAQTLAIFMMEFLQIFGHFLHSELFPHSKEFWSIFGVNVRPNFLEAYWPFLHEFLQMFGHFFSEFSAQFHLYIFLFFTTP